MNLFIIIISDKFKKKILHHAGSAYIKYSAKKNTKIKNFGFVHETLLLQFT